MNLRSAETRLGVTHTIDGTTLYGKPCKITFSVVVTSQDDGSRDTVERVFNAVCIELTDIGEKLDKAANRVARSSP